MKLSKVWSYVLVAATLALAKLPTIIEVLTDTHSSPTAVHVLSVVLALAGLVATLHTMPPGSGPTASAPEVTQPLKAIMGAAGVALACAMLILGCTKAQGVEAETIAVDATKLVCSPLDPFDAVPYVQFACAVAEAGEGLAAKSLTVQVPQAQAAAFHAKHCRKADAGAVDAGVSDAGSESAASDATDAQDAPAVVPAWEREYPIVQPIAPGYLQAKGTP